ncbi:MAG: lamin tail domain-containing protein, partial [Verrucomicrobiales bacterium]
LGYETGGLPVPLATTLTQPALNPTFVMTHYFETDFTLSAAEIAGLDEVSLSHLVDDGAIFYLNGQEITRYKMGAEPTTAASQANAGGEAALVSGVSVPKSLFVVGTNRLSVEVHQSSPGSSDIVFGLRLDSTEAFEPFQKSDDQWIELLNRGATPVDLEGWEFTDGISFTFPAGTALGAGEFLVVARDAGALAARFPGIEILGDWGGNLSRGGERLILRDGNKNIADEVRFFDDGSWPADADGGGASLELIDPDADNGSAGSWEASDEGARSSWQTYSYRASGANHGNDPTQYNEFVFGLLDNGEFLLDDISVVENPDGAARQLIQNGDFSGGNSNFWRLLGTHRHAEVVDDPDSAGNKVLHMATNGSTEHMHNHAETTLKDGGNFVTINGGSQYE